MTSDINSNGNGYNLQDSTMIGMNSSYPYNGTIAFSNSIYWTAENEIDLTN